MSEIQSVPVAMLHSYQIGPPLPQVAAPAAPAPATPAPTAPTTASPGVAGTISRCSKPGAVYDATTGYYTNPDGSIYYPATSAGNYVSTSPTYNSVLEPGATYNATTGMYTNPDGTIYDPSATVAATASTFDLTEPSTWPTWVWLALAAGGTWLLFLRRR